MASAEAELLQLVRAIGTRDVQRAARMVRANPELAATSMKDGASRDDAASYYFEPIDHYVYAGDTALHMAAAAHQPELVSILLESGADTR